MLTVRAMIVSSGFPYGVISFLFIAIIVCCLTVNSGRALNDYILHFEPVFFDQYHLKEHHRRSVRSSASMDRYIHLQFVAYKRVFRLRLERDPWVFADYTEFVSSESTVHYDMSRAVTGHVEGEENSSVQGVILSSGLFDGSIRIGDDEMYVEPAQNYFSKASDFHSVIYRRADVHYPETNRTCIDAPRIPISKFRHKKNHSKRNHSWERLYQEDMASSDRSQIYYWRDLDSLHYTESGSSSSEPYGVRSVQRTQWPEDGGSSRRGSVAVDRRKSTCLLYLQADHLFYRRLGGEEACIDAMTRHVQRVNSIYRNTVVFLFDCLPFEWSLCKEYVPSVLQKPRLIEALLYKEKLEKF